jgi:hypothetical protein
MRLIDDLAARRCLYQRPMLTMPDVLLIDVPETYAFEALPLGRYYPILLEAGHELAEIEAFLAADRSQLTQPNLFDRRPSATESACVVVSRYRSPAFGWPWLLVCLWPAAYTAMAPTGSDLFARGAYTTEVYPTRDDMIEGKPAFTQPSRSSRSITG